MEIRNCTELAENKSRCEALGTVTASKQEDVCNINEAIVKILRKVFKYV